MIFRAYMQPNDPRWRGRQRWGPVLFLPITFIFIVIWILFIADQAYSRVLWEKYNKAREEAIRTKSYNTIPPSPPVNWDNDSSYGQDGVDDFFLRAGIAIIPETFHIPIHHVLIHKNRNHPVAALTLSIICMGLWLSSGLMTLFIWWSKEYSHSETNAFDELVMAGMGLQFVLTLLYLIYMGFAAAAVHKWRGNKKNGEAFQKGVIAGLELASMKKPGEDERV
ncbi:hypothetical protein K469DRAFT_40972 [Zopfia rhizophila CBS 207.26]|uniref:Uncharacterized protein n=1 Tax=Zopfia rhizophila CBS 207.26 TaxID=1314779 RepID=A0A6A6EH83_9PEZI|nr:hypothetical protein K469DRAFT_40972 [Zopfia rhizophila CBS 207.26]